MRFMKIYLFAIIGLLSSSVFAQESLASDAKLLSLPQHHDSLKVYNHALIHGETENERSQASYSIIKVLAKALRMEGSFEYDFDSLNSISIQTPADKQFRVFTWQLARDNGTHRYFGVIQHSGEKPSIQPLVDYTDFYESPSTVIVDANRWMGALYYNIIPFTHKKKDYYALLGWNAHNRFTNKKYIEILWFDENGQAKFGYPVFDTGKKNELCRVILEYKKDAILSLNYYPNKKQIFFDHLVSLSGQEEEGALDMVPDGTIEAFELKKGWWKHIELVEYDRLEDGDVPNVSEKQKRPLYQPLQKR